MASRDIVRSLQDLTNLDWNERASSSGTAGTYLKARTGSGSRLIYYKLPRYNGVVIDGYECVNELLASRLMDALGVNHLAYRLIHAKVLIDGVGYETWLNSSRNFRKVGERKLSLGAFFDLYKNPGESPIELCRRFGWQEDGQSRSPCVEYRGARCARWLVQDCPRIRYGPFASGAAGRGPRANRCFRPACGHGYDELRGQPLARGEP